MNKRETAKGYKVFSPFLRIFHWTMVLSVIILFFTGLYIGDPTFGGFIGVEPTFAVDSATSMSFIRKIHFATAFIFIASFILRFYGAFINKGDRLVPKFWHVEFWEGIVWALKHYLFMKVDQRFYLRNSLARFAYAMAYTLILVIAISGLAMYVAVFPDTVIGKVFRPLVSLVGEYNLHLVHHVFAWFMIIFAIVHFYMLLRCDITEKNSEFSSMISGVKYYSVEPFDLQDIETDKEVVRKIRADRARYRVRAKKQLKARKPSKKA